MTPFSRHYHPCKTIRHCYNAISRQLNNPNNFWKIHSFWVNDPIHSFFWFIFFILYNLYFSWGCKVFLSDQNCHSLTCRNPSSLTKLNDTIYLTVTTYYYNMTFYCSFFSGIHSFLVCNSMLIIFFTKCVFVESDISQAPFSAGSGVHKSGN